MFRVEKSKIFDPHYMSINTKSLYKNQIKIFKINEKSSFSGSCQPYGMSMKLQYCPRTNNPIEGWRNKLKRIAKKSKILPQCL